MRGRSPGRALYALACVTVSVLGAACSPDDPSREAPEPGPSETVTPGTPEAAIAAWLRCEECVDGEREAVLAVGDEAVPALRNALLDGPPERERLEWQADMRSLHARLRAQADARGLALADVDEFVDRRVGNLVLRYRARAADALGWIGGGRARDALEEAARAEAGEGRLLERIQAVLASM